MAPVLALTMAVVGTGAGAARAAATGPSAPSVSAAFAAELRHLPKVGAAVTDGESETSLFLRAMTLIAVGRSAAPLRAAVARAEQVMGRDAATARLDEKAARAATAAAATAGAAALLAAAQYGSLATEIQQMAVRLYMSGGTPAQPPTVAATSAQQLVWAQSYLDTVVDPQGALHARAAALAARRAETRRRAEAEAEARAEAAGARAMAVGERAAYAGLQAQLARADIGNVGAILADHQALAAQEAAELTGPKALEFTPSVALPAPVSTTAVALTWAFSELGQPYLWGGTGPAAFDCSGLMQYVWRKAGVSIPRVAADQDAWTDPVPLSQLLPGDLVFYGTYDIHHVGMYIGDGLMINAPHTGTVVQVSSIWWSDLAGFGRVHAAGTPTASHQLPTATHPAPKVTKAPKPVPSETKPPAHKAGHKPKKKATPPPTGGSTTTTTSTPPTTSPPTTSTPTTSTTTTSTTTTPPTTNSTTTNSTTTVTSTTTTSTTTTSTTSVRTTSTTNPPTTTPPPATATPF